jgi:hypothetical protein
MQDPAHRSGKIFIYSLVFVICTLALLFIFFFVSSRCSQLILWDIQPSECLVGVSLFWLEGGILVITLFSLYQVNRLMNSKK